MFLQFVEARQMQSGLRAVALKGNADVASNFLPRPELCLAWASVCLTETCYDLIGNRLKIK